MKKIIRNAVALISAAVLTATGAAPCISQKPMTATAVDTNNDDWLHAEGSRLYDMNGNEVWLTGANWFGLNCIEGAPHYLWSGDCDDLVREVADRGINVIRFPISSELLVSWMNGEPPQLSGGGMQASYNPPEDMDDGNGGIIKAGTYGSINKEFVEADGKTLIDTERSFDIILGKLKKYGIKAFIDVHSPHTDNSGHNYNLWYGKAGITTEKWIESLVWLADKYKDDDTLIAYDLKNEPHGKGPEGDAAAKWDDSKDENNWAYAATRCAEAILDVNPHALILIEGVEQSLSGAQEGDYWGMPDRKTNSPYIGAWWGGNFRGARKNPIKPILAAQLCSEFREFFPENAVEYFVSYYDYYQPEAYVPSTDSYIEKDSSINDEIDKLRHSATTALAERRDVIIVASVSCIYSLGSPEEYRSMCVSIRQGAEKPRDQLISELVKIRYERNDIAFERNRFRVRGDVVEIFPAMSTDTAIRVEYFGDEIDRISEVNVVTGEVKAVVSHAAVFPASLSMLLLR